VTESISMRVERVWDEAEEIRAFELRLADGGALPPVEAGSHIDLHLAPGLIRQYSLCNEPGETEHYIIAVKREGEGRGGSRHLHERVRAGDLIKVVGPRNNFPLNPVAVRSVLLAGGIGVTPLLSMARQLAAAGASFQLEYFTRSLPHTAFREALTTPPLARHAALHPGLELPQLDLRLRELLGRRMEGAHLYICGPLPFMDLARGIAARFNWPPEAVHFEYFKAEPSVGTGDVAERFTVELSKTGGSYDVPSDRTIVQVLLDHGIEVPVSCEQGVCGTCVTRVLEGEPDHRDMYLTDSERAAGDQITPCVSRSRSKRLVLDL
jgi:vanillate O-demethylase ferredoxin subunit